MAFNITIPEDLNFNGSYNISPGKASLVVTGENPKQASMFVFGLTPYWAKKPLYLINARAEGDFNKENNRKYSGAKGIINKPAFRKPIRSQRCLVLADAFVEGTTKEKLAKPFIVYLRDRKPFAMAGIWDRWYDPDTGEELNSFAIITTVANDLLSMLPHHRSPVILEKSMEEAWLHANNLSDITWMLKPYPSEKMNAFPISSAIRNPRVDGRHLIEPAGERLLVESRVISTPELKLQGMGSYKVRPKDPSGHPSDPET